MRIPTLGPNTLGSVATHLQTHHGAQPAGPWRLRFRPFRTVRGAHSAEHTKGLRTEATEDTRRQRRVMWEVTDASQPQAVFLLFEDAALPTRAEMGTERHEKSSRWHCHVVSADFATLLRHTNLPGPLGTPPGTLGPGAWIQRGANIAFDGISFHIRLAQPHATLLGTAPEQDECILSIGNVIVGADRVVGGIVEIQYTPLQRLPPNSSLLGSLLMALLPPDLLPLMTPVPAPPHESLILPSSVAVRTMLAPSQLAEVVPASTREWREPERAEESLDPEAFPPWEAEPNYVPDSLGWTGVEPRRRMAFVYLTMLRSEGLA